MTNSSTTETAKSAPRPLVWIGVVLLVYTLLVGVTVIGEGFKWLTGGAEGAATIFSFASNPLVGVILGTLATALVQSSSTVTSVIVGMVAGGLPVSTAVPMIMGANMGTTITNTIVSLGDIGKRDTFKKAFQAATVHHFFNLYSIVIFLPLEILFHPLERMGGAIAEVFAGDANASISDANLLGAITKPIAEFLVSLFEALPSATLGACLVIAVGISLIIASVLYLGKLLQAVMTGKAKSVFESAVGRNRETGVLSGTVVTVLVQSSSTSTSLIVPIAGAGVLTLRQVFPFTMGANIGTCITALLAATAITGANEVLALQIALVHLLYNVFGVLFFLYIPFLYELPIKSAHWLGERTEKNRSWAFGYILGVFFLIPGAVFGTLYTLGSRADSVSETEEIRQSVETVTQELEQNPIVID
jgi:sodium-dependent phosphate cotransporter